MLSLASVNRLAEVQEMMLSLLAHDPKGLWKSSTLCKISSTTRQGGGFVGSLPMRIPAPEARTPANDDHDGGKAKHGWSTIEIGNTYTCRANDGQDRR